MSYVDYSCDCCISGTKLYKIEAIKVLLAFYDNTRKTQRLAMIALESDMLEKIDYERIIEDFISKNAQRIKFFK